MATVITNLLSAIPVFGHDLVELIWGGLNLTLLDIEIYLIKEEPYYSDIVLQILLVAGKRSFNEIGYCYYARAWFANASSDNLIVKKLIARTLPAEIQSNISIELSQRLHAGDLEFAWLVGLIEGDGWFSITKGGKYLKYEFGIELGIRDVQLIYKIKDLLGVGEINFRDTEGRSKTVILRVRKKSHLINVILPIFDKYPFISNKQYDYLRFKDNLLKGITLYENLDINYVRPLEPLNNVDYIISLPYFSSWLIGFIEAEGCFSVYRPSDRDSFVVSFDISQTNSREIISAICKYLSFTQKVTKDNTNNFKIKVSSVRSVENVIKFLQNAPVKLKGHKKLQYLLWIKELRNIPRYKNKINIPDII